MYFERNVINSVCTIKFPEKEWFVYQTPSFTFKTRQWVQVSASQPYFPRPERQNSVISLYLILSDLILSYQLNGLNLGSNSHYHLLCMLYKQFLITVCITYYLSRGKPALSTFCCIASLPFKIFKFCKLNNYTIE